MIHIHVSKALSSPTKTLRPQRAFFVARWILAAAWVAGASTGARAEVHHVPNQYGTIQAAIDACAASDVVMVAPGTYSGPGNVDLDFHGVDLTCTSTAGPLSTTINAGAPGFHSAFALHSGETRAAIIDGFTIVYGEAVAGGGIHCTAASPTIRNCVIRDCGANYGGGIYLSGSGALVQYVTITTCRATFDGRSERTAAAVYLVDSPASFEDCVFSGNLAPGLPYVPAAVTAIGGGVFLRCVITGNEGAGISADPASIDHCVLAFNDQEELRVVTSAEITGSILWDKCDTADIYLAPKSRATFECTLLDPSKLTGPGIAEFLSPAIPGNPNFCDIPNCPSIPSVDGNFAVFPDSPARPENNPCHDFLGANHSDSCDPASVDRLPVVANLSLSTVRPNPTRARIELSFHLPEAANVRVSLIEPSGRRLAVMPPVHLQAGANRWAGDLRSATGAELCAGVYSVEVDAGGILGNAQFVLLAE